MHMLVVYVVPPCVFYLKGVCKHHAARKLMPSLIHSRPTLDNTHFIAHVSCQASKCALQMSVDTACSSTLVATHLAMQHLQEHGGASFAAGVNLALAETTTIAAQAAGMLTLDGHCKTLDANADGYVRSKHTSFHEIPTASHSPICPNMIM